MRGGYGKIHYALIGLAPYSFHYDMSKTPRNKFLLLQYLIAFNDLHNFHVSVENYQKLLRTEYLQTKLPFEPFDLNNPYMTPKTSPRFFTPQKRLKAREIIDKWNERYFPETRLENIKILDEYLTICEDNNIRPIMFLPPMTEGYKKHFNRERLYEFYYLVGQACKKHSAAIFIDGWQLNFFTDADFHDVAHMNVQGAIKFSAFLNEIVELVDAKHA